MHAHLRSFGVLALSSILWLGAVQAEETKHHPKLSPPIVHLQAQATTEVAQDTVRFVLFVQEQGIDQKHLAQEINQVLAHAQEQAKELIGDKDIEIYTGAFSVSPRYNDQGEIATWQARAELVLESTLIDETAEIAGQLNDQMSIAQIRFSLSDTERTRHEEQLTENAIAAFEKRAQLMVQSLGHDYYQLKELTIDGGSVVYRSQDYSAPRGVMMAAAAEDQKIAVAAGQEEVSVTVRGAIYLLDKTDTCQ